MSYKFGNQIEPETLNHVPEFKEQIDSIVANSKFAVVVGWRPDGGYQTFEFLKEHNINTYVVEVFQSHYNAFRMEGIKKVHSDIRNYINFLPESHRDCLIWLDGPNNVEMQEVRGMLRQAQEEFNSIVIATPRGFVLNGPYLDNMNEINLSHWYHDNYEDLDFKWVSYLDGKGLIGYWTKEEKIEHEVVEPFVPNSPPAIVVEPEPEHPESLVIKVNVSKLTTRLHLPNVTCLCADTTYYKGTMDSLWWNYCQVKFARMILFTDERIYEKIGNLERAEAMGLEIIAIKPIQGKNGIGSYSDFMIKYVAKYIKTSHFLICQQDGWICNPRMWSDEFLEFDYGGSPWLFYPDTDPMKVGNGGFSLRSTKLHAVMANDPHVDGTTGAEDFQICRFYRPMLEKKYGIKFMPLEVAQRFSYDGPQPPGEAPSPLPLGFHQVDTKGYETSYASIYGYYE